MNIFRFVPILAIAISSFSYAQSQTPETGLLNLKSKYEIEKIFIHFDKNNYIAGETIWFKAYLMAGFYPANYSTTLYVCLLNDSGVIIKQQFLPIIGSGAAGNFELTKELPQGIYTIQAYTKRLLNFGSAYFYNKSIPIYNPATITAKVAQPVNTPNVYFLPEGGDLVVGVSNTVAFKAVDEYGGPVSVEGEVKNNNGESFAKFSSIHDGMGKFQLTPFANESYYADITVNNSFKFKKDLPRAKVSGIVFQVITAADKTNFFITREKVASEQTQPAYLLGVMENEVVFRNELPAVGFIKGQIPVDKIPSGILQMTIFTKDNQPLAERLIFVDNEDYLIGGRFITDTVSLKARGKNNFSFTLHDTLQGSYSVAITDIGQQIASTEKETIVSGMLLTNQLTGYIHNPAFYFSSRDSKVKAALDLVMLTHGWRRYNWEQILNNRLPSMSSKDDEYITVKGKAYNEFSNKLLQNTSLTGLIKLGDSTDNFISIPIDSAGNFEISGLIFQDTASLTFQNIDTKNRETLLKVATQPLTYGFNFIQPSQVGLLKPISRADDETMAIIKKNYSDLLASKEKMITLNEVKLASVTAREKAKAVEDRYRKNGMFSAGARTSLNFITDPPKSDPSLNIFEYLKGRLSSINVSGSLGNYFLNFRNARTLSGGPIPMTIFLDEMEVTSQQASTVRLGDVAMVQVLGTGFVGVGSGGALAIYLKKGADALGPQVNGMRTMKIIGYSPVKEFFSPDYFGRQRNSGDVDARTTLYWDPYLMTNAANKKISIPFFNSDKAKKLKVVMMGTTEDGKLLYIEKIVE